MKRFYAAVDTAPEAVGHVVRLDARPVRTPARNALAIPSLALAEAVAEEWRRQGEEIAPDTMPLTRLATTVLDLMPARREDAVEEAAGFAGTDLLCYRAVAPQVLSARQRAAWQPWLDWAERQYDARLIVTARSTRCPSRRRRSRPCAAPSSGSTTGAWSGCTRRRRSRARSSRRWPSSGRR